MKKIVRCFHTHQGSFHTLHSTLRSARGSWDPWELSSSLRTTSAPHWHPSRATVHTSESTTNQPLHTSMQIASTANVIKCLCLCPPPRPQVEELTNRGWTARGAKCELRLQRRRRRRKKNLGPYCRREKRFPARSTVSFLGGRRFIQDGVGGVLCCTTLTPSFNISVKCSRTRAFEKAYACAAREDFSHGVLDSSAPPRVDHSPHFGKLVN